MANQTTGIEFDRGTLRLVSRNLELAAGKATKIVGTLAELMSYAVKVELGEGRVMPKPHMRPAYAAMLVEAVPQLALVLRRALAGPVQDYDRVVFNAVGLAMLTMEKHRVNKLRELVYTAERLARQREESYRGYKLTGNLMQNRQIIVQAIGAGLRESMSKSKLGSVPGVPGGA